MARPSRSALAAVVLRTQAGVDSATQTAAEVKVALQQIRSAVDPREVAGGFVGLATGEAIGGAVGGMAGAVMAGPAGAVVGAEVGAFTAGMLGLKLGMDAVQDLRAVSERAGDAGKTAQTTTPPQGTVAEPAAAVTPRFFRRKMTGRAGEILGLTTGATAGLVIAGPPGGLLGAVVGETVGGQIKRGFGKSQATPGVLWHPMNNESITRWLDRFGKKTAGEAATVLVAGSVGSLFGATGLKVGQRIGRVVSQRIEWDKLGKDV